MAQPQFSLSWGEHRKNMCTGLSVLQQRGEFVDMTLAADGHFVKVHQVILALASPYIKDLISSAQCPHPVLFLNKISYKTLCAILEYIYTGEVYISIGNLPALSEAAKELRIKGLEDVNVPNTIPATQQPTQGDDTLETQENDYSAMETLDEEIYFDVSEKTDDKSVFTLATNHMTDSETTDSKTNTETVDDTYNYTYSEEQREELQVENYEVITGDTPVNTGISDEGHEIPDMTVMQYTASTQGSLQMILNRFVYYLKHTNRDGSRQWRCVDYLSQRKCPAHVSTRGGVVVLRVSAHTHPFHDQKILKKVQSGAVFSAMQDACRRGERNKTTKGARHHNNE